MPNKNYKSGRAFEYETQKRWEEKGYATIRASGSHGQFDVVAFRSDRKPEFIQCKVCNDEAEAKRLLKQFISDTIPSLNYHQTMTIKVKRKGITEVTI